MEDSRGVLFVRFISSPMFIGGFFSLYSIFVRFYIYPRYSIYLAEDSSLIQSFIEWFGVAYGLLIALVLVNVWDQFNNTEREFDREADAILMLYESVNQIEDGEHTKEFKGKIISSIQDYVKHVTDNYVVEQYNLRSRYIGDHILDEIRDLIGELVHLEERESINSELIKEFNEAMDVRGDRISRSRQRIPKPVWAIALASSILWVIPFYGLDFKNNWVAIFLIGGVTAIVVAILVIIRDLDDPFEGTWKIDIEEWEILGEKIELKPILFFIYNLGSSPINTIWARFQKMYSKHPCALHELSHAKYQLPRRRRKPSVARSAAKRTTRKTSFFNDLAEDTYYRVVYKDQIDDLYEKTNPLPIILYKSKNKTEVLLKPAEIKRFTTPTGLVKKIRKKLSTLQI